MNGILDLVISLDSRWVLAGLLTVLDAWAIGLIVKARPSPKVGILWAAIIVLCPIIGLLFWYALGPKPVPRPISGR
ncbi:MAG: PLDc N-terminal domain-containing protein [Candidatus Palauibacterales bacterium]|nr:PLDc N-terminal domain-containing protein [Candidatus Palauibacterales bacterium]